MSDRSETPKTGFLATRLKGYTNQILACTISVNLLLYGKQFVRSAVALDCKIGLFVQNNVKTRIIRFIHIFDGCKITFSPETCDCCLLSSKEEHV